MMRNAIKARVLAILVTLGWILTACTTTAAPTAAVAPSATPATAPAATSTITPSPSPTPLPGLWISPDLPAGFVLEVNPPAGLQVVGQKEEAAFLLMVSPDRPVSQWIYALAAPFPTITDDITGSDLVMLWGREEPADTLPYITRLLVDENTRAVFTALWGEPGAMVQTLPVEELLNTAWEEKTAWAILPFQEIQPEWKVIRVDGISPLHKDFAPEGYALTVPVSLLGSRGETESPSIGAVDWLPATNRDQNKLTTVMLTGVTALVRATAAYMEIYGYTYPAEIIAPILQDGDILHVSNEIPFAEKCPRPGLGEQNGLVFCSRDVYIELLEFIGTDVVELTGDHFQDWGAEAMLHTLDLYDQRGWQTYGGGANLEDARQPVLVEQNGNKIAFLGCNGKQPGYAQASPTQPGAYHCDLDWMASEVQKLVSDGYLPIVTFQHEEYYETIARPALQADFRRMAEAGAVVVSGSQAHQPHIFEFDNGALIHYGLGNLFFDQVNWCEACSSAFLDRHVFYDGQYLGVELITIRFEDYARSRLTTPEERQALLESVFAAGGW
ncbi:MAG TPA: CapA family protein [Anaerolineaceae bacterium]|nr:CapA family protein [Anaerolineaceae bacterium]